MLQITEMNLAAVDILFLKGRSVPLAFASLLLFVKVVCQLFSGRLLNGKWQTWVRRTEGPQTYWTVTTIEALAVLGGFYVAMLR